VHRHSGRSGKFDDCVGYDWKTSACVCGKSGDQEAPGKHPDCGKYKLKI